MAAVIVNPQDWSTGSPIYYLLGLGNQKYNVHNAGSGYTYDLKADYALTSTDGNALRFEVRAGDKNWFDMGSGSERSEIASTDRIDYGQPMNISYNFNLEPGAPNTAKWLVIGQIHQAMPSDAENFVPPPVSVNLIGERMSVTARYMDANGKIIENVVYKDTANIVRGHDYDIDIKAVFDADGQGRLVIVRDGVVIVDYAGALGYSYEGQVYWKEGVYRSPASETIAATFSDLKISHGDMVEIPAKGTPYNPMAEAPKISYEGGEKGGAGAQVALSGEAAPGVEVRIYINEKLSYTTHADASGRYAVNAELGSGSHIVTAATVGADGRLSAVSNELAFDVGTTTEIIDRISAIDAKYDLSGVFLTDTNVIKVSSINQMKDLLADDAKALQAIDGGYTFEFHSGTANNRTVTSYDSNGISVSSVTRALTNGELVRETYQYFSADAPFAKEVYQYNIKGQAYTSSYQAYGADGELVSMTQTYANGVVYSTYNRGENGLGTTQSFNSEGVHTSTTLTHAKGDGSGLSSEIYTYNISGKSYVSTYTAIDTDGKVVETIRSRADGTPDYISKLQPDGTTVALTYATSGALSSKTVTETDGSSVRETYDSAGQVTLMNILHADKTSEIIAFTNGVMSSKTVVHNAGDPFHKEVYTYKTTGEPYLSSYKAYDADNKMVGNERYFANGQTEYSFWIDEAGTSVTIRYAASGAKTSEATIFADGSTDSKTYTGGVLTRETVVFKTPDETGASKYVYEFNIANKTYGSKVSVYDAAGKLISTETYPEPEIPTVLDTVPEAPTLYLSTGGGASQLALSAKTGDIDASDSEPLIVGTAAPGIVVTLFNGETVVATTRAGADGRFTFKVEDLSDGSLNLTAKAVDATGRSSEASDIVSLSVYHSQVNGSTVHGSFGADFLFGGTGDDVFIVNRAADVIIDRGGTDMVKSSVSHVLGSGIENLTLTGKSNIDGIGNSGDNNINGNDGDNYIDGMAGADRMAGGRGNDTYVVDNRSDKVIEFQDQGIDTVLSSVTYSLGANVENLTLTGTDKIGGTGNALDNVLTGNSKSNTLSAGDGNDRLDGGLGSDFLSGGNGQDTFIFSTALSAGNVDRITDFANGQDRIELASSIFGALPPGALDASLFRDIAQGSGTGQEIILYDSATGKLYYDADAAGVNAPVHFATLDNHAFLTQSDFVIV